MRVETGFRSESESEPSRLNETQLACCTAHREVSFGKGDITHMPMVVTALMPMGGCPANGREITDMPM